MNFLVVIFGLSAVSFMLSNLVIVMAYHFGVIIINSFPIVRSIKIIFMFLSL
jgi:hypothetical protein